MEDRCSGRSSRARDIIDRIVSDERFRASSHFSTTVYRDEPLLTTGRQMAGYLPDEYAPMKAVSRWEEQPGGARGRWLSEAELFYRQGLALADVEDDCPYRGTYKSTYPTYSTMSDRQLRGYVSWRSRVRKGDIEATLPAFAITYLQELICGIGTSGPLDGFERLSSFASAYRGVSPEVDRRAPVWLQDYAIYHGLAPQLLPCSAELQREEHILRFTETLKRVRETTGLSSKEKPRRTRGGLPGIGDADAVTLYESARSLASTGSTPNHEDTGAREDLCHVACAVLARLDEHYRRTRKTGLAASLFGEAVELPYTMFASAVFFDPKPHPDAEVALSALHRYRCRNGLWTCTHIHGAQAGTMRLADLLRDIESTTRARWEGADAPDTTLPKYLVKFVVSEADARAAWRSEHAPVQVRIDTSKLAGIRTAAACTREALLIDDERLEEGAEGSAILASAIEASRTSTHTAASTEDAAPCENRPLDTERTQPRFASESEAGPLSAEQSAYLVALLDGGARIELSQSEDLVVDQINEALFDLVGDTVLEFGPQGVCIIEDYRPDLEGFVHHD